MQFIRETINIISIYKVQRIKILGNQYGSDTKLSSFYKGVKEGTIKTDEDAIRLLYNTEQAGASYNKLKNRLKNRLINTLFFIDVNDASFTDIQKAYYTCYKEWAAVRILFGRSAKKSAVRLAEKLIKTAIRFEFTEIIFNISRVLRLYYATTTGGKKKYRYYKQLFKTYKDYLEAESLAEELYEELLINFVGTRATKAKHVYKAQAFAKELEPYIDKVPTFNFIFFAYSILVLQYEIVNDHQNVILQSQRALKILNNKSFQLKGQCFPFSFKIFSCYLKLGQYDLASATATECLHSVDEGTINWFKFHQAFFCFKLYTKQYAEAAHVLNKVMQHPRFTFQSQDTQENWRILMAYTYFLTLIGKIGTTSLPKSVTRKFRLSKFLNEVPVFSKDKRGYNIAILIIQILILLAQRKYDPIIDRTDALERYFSRYLRQDATFRSSCFVKMLALLPKGYFNKIAVERRAESLLDKLKTCPLHSANQSMEIEIVPYERLWDFVMELMGKRVSTTPDSAATS